MTTENLTPEAPARRPNTLRTVLLVIGSIVLALIIVGTVTRVAFSLNRDDTSGTYTVEQRFDEITLRTTAADIDVEYDDVNAPELRFHQGNSNLRLDYDVSGTELKIRVGHPGWGWFGGGWIFGDWGIGNWDGRDDARLTVALPQSLERDGVALAIKSTAGNLTVFGDYGDVDVESTAGHLRMTGATDDLRINTTAGEVRLDGVSVDGAFRSESTAGDGTFDFESLPDSIDAQSTAGEIHVTLPRGSYRIETSTTAGEVRQHVSSNRDADRVYRFESTAGDIELNER